jgi:hypothetical protein
MIGISHLDRRKRGIAMARKRKGIKTEDAAVISSPERSEAPQETQQNNQEILSSAVSIRERVALLAYSYWQERGCQGGSPEEDWFRAEREILGQFSISEP